MINGRHYYVDKNATMEIQHWAIHAAHSYGEITMKRGKKRVRAALNIWILSLLYELNSQLSTVAGGIYYAPLSWIATCAPSSTTHHSAFVFEKQMKMFYQNMISLAPAISTTQSPPSARHRVPLVAILRVTFWPYIVTTSNYKLTWSNLRATSVAVAVAAASAQFTKMIRCTKLCKLNKCFALFHSICISNSDSKCRRWHKCPGAKQGRKWINSHNVLGMQHGITIIRNGWFVPFMRILLFFKCVCRRDLLEHSASSWNLFSQKCSSQMKLCYNCIVLVRRLVIMPVCVCASARNLSFVSLDKQQNLF